VSKRGGLLPRPPVVAEGETVLGIIPFIGKVVAAFEFLAIWELRKVNRSWDAIAIHHRNWRQGAQRSDAENLRE
jgi:hypothetical protein